MTENHIIELDDLDGMKAEAAAAPVGTLPKDEPTAATTHEPEAMTAEEWKEGNFYSVTITADTGDAAKKKQVTAGSYDEYIALREAAHEAGLYIVTETFLTKEQYFPGLLTYNAAVDVFRNTNDKYIEFENFPEFSKTSKIRLHDSVVLAADTGAGKSSLALNFINDLNPRHPVILFNLEMDQITVLRRLVSIHTGLTLDQIEGYRNDERTAKQVDDALKEITNRKPLQIINDVYELKDIEAIIKHTIQFRPDGEPTIVVVDHSLLVQAGTANRYERFTEISEHLRKLAKDNDIILFILLQQNRDGKKDETEPPKNWSLKESGSWENDATHICFLWWDPTAQRKKLIMTKNRGGKAGIFVLEYTANTQKYREETTRGATGRASTPTLTRKKTQREKRKEKLDTAAQLAQIKATLEKREVSVNDLAREADVTPGTIKNWIKEFGGYEINGKHYEPAGVDDIVTGEGFTKPRNNEIPKDIDN